jgi:hypothetical protein
MLRAHIPSRLCVLQVIDSLDKRSVCVCGSTYSTEDGLGGHDRRRGAIRWESHYRALYTIDIVDRHGVVAFDVEGRRCLTGTHGLFIEGD